MEVETFVAGNLVRAVDHPEWGIGSIEELAGDVAHVRFYCGVNYSLELALGHFW
jgi:hypothetical protein